MTQRNSDVCTSSPIEAVKLWFLVLVVKDIIYKVKLIKISRILKPKRGINNLILVSHENYVKKRTMSYNVLSNSVRRLSFERFQEVSFSICEKELK